MIGQDIFGVTVPEEDLQPPSFGPMNVGTYETTLLSGAEQVENGGQFSLELPFGGEDGFQSVNGGESYFHRSLAARFTLGYQEGTELTSGRQKSIQIGTQSLIAAARTFGLAAGSAEEGWRLTATSVEELIGQFNAVAGTRAKVFVKQKESQNLNPNTGKPYINNLIGSILPAE